LPTSLLKRKRPVVFLLSQSLALQEINRKDRRMAAVAAAESQGAVFEIGKPGDRSPVTATILVIQPTSVSRIAISRQRRSLPHRPG